MKISVEEQDGSQDKDVLGLGTTGVALLGAGLGLLLIIIIVVVVACHYRRRYRHLKRRESTRTIISYGSSPPVSPGQFESV